jgi:hypothetical protein
MALADITNNSYFLDEIHQSVLDAVNQAIALEKSPKTQPGSANKRQKRDYDESQRLQIAEYALQFGNAAARRKFLSEWGIEISSSTVHSIKKAYLLVKANNENITALPAQVGGRPTHLGDWDAKLQSLIRNMRAAGSIINRNIVIATAKGFIGAMQPSLLAENGGPLTLENPWAYSFLKE